jgi:hypothetical protein
VTSCSTRLVVLDDLHFVDFKHRHGIEVSNHLKGLANEMAVTFVYVGVKLAEKRFFDEGMLGEQAAYAQTSRRATRCPVAPFRIDSDAGIRGWISLLRALETHIKLADARPGMLVGHAKILHNRTQGRIAWWSPRRRRPPSFGTSARAGIPPSLPSATPPGPSPNAPGFPMTTARPARMPSRPHSYG